MTAQEKRLRCEFARPVKAVLRELYGYRLVFNGCYWDRAWIELDGVTEEIVLTDAPRVAILEVCERLAQRYEDAAAEHARSASDSVWKAMQREVAS